MAGGENDRRPDEKSGTSRQMPIAEVTLDVAHRGIGTSAGAQDTRASVGWPDDCVIGAIGEPIESDWNGLLGKTHQSSSSVPCSAASGFCLVRCCAAWLVGGFAGIVSAD